MDKQELLLQEKINLQRQIEIKNGLPHLHGFKFYKWSRQIFESLNKLNFLTAGNQLSKSSTMIRKCIHWATEETLWPKLWKTNPRVFIYLYPSFDVATREVETKWIPEFLPRDKYRDSKKYGWKLEYDKKDIKLIRFNSGVCVYFLAYAQAAKMLQATSAHAVFCDEEPPEALFPELRFRLAATDGYMHLGFTATLGQEFFRLIMEERGLHELFPQALKIQVSAYDCMVYEDGTPSPWTEQRIKELIASCPSESEVKRRVFGKFVVSEGRRYPNFSRKCNVKKVTEPIPHDWQLYSGVDIGSGGERSHPGAITFIAVRPDYKKGRLFKHWNGVGEVTAASDIFQRWLEMRGQKRCAAQAYDFSSKDFGLISERAGEGFLLARKDRIYGDNIINSLFKHEILDIDDIPENYPLIRELEALTLHDRKTIVKDDSSDSMRYTVTLPPWDWEFLNHRFQVKKEEPETIFDPMLELDRQRREAAKNNDRGGINEMLPGDEIDFWQEQIEPW